VSQKLGGTYSCRKAIVLRHVSDTTANGNAVRCILTEHARRTGSWTNETEQNLDRGAFPGAVLSKNSGNTVGNPEAHIIKRDDFSVLLREMLELEKRLASSHDAAFGFSHAGS
jgi:hypothetical protein